jgi:hypothetical protein
MKVNGAKFAGLHDLMIGMGLPRALVRAEGEVARTDVSACTHAKYKPVPPAKQLRDATACMNDPRGSWLWAVASRNDPDLVNLLVLEFFRRCVNNCLKDPANYSRPNWHGVYGGNRDRLRDDERYRQELGLSGPLILDNVSCDCPPDKLEKVRDLAHMFKDRPVVLLINGGDPLQFCVDRLHFRPERLTFVNRNRARALRQE